ncbi:MAG: hypothetical protein E4H46_04430 [Desulfobacterales bacterium]|nr:MAG: hypothetical protein E4H46_04430 [Desulfobacterales bacterium]
MCTSFRIPVSIAFFLRDGCTGYRLQQYHIRRKGKAIGIREFFMPRIVKEDIARLIRKALGS